MNNVIEDGEVEEKTSRRTFWRQTLVCSGLWTAGFMYGLCLGSPTVLIPQVRKEANSTDVISDEMASWLSSAFSFGALPWVVLLPLLVQIVGRKRTFMFTCISTFVGFLVLYCSTNTTQILISEVIQGAITANNVITSIMVVPEYTSPKYRGIFFTIKSATHVWGIWVSNAIGTFFHWKNIGILGLICSCYGVVNVMFWPESPLWLASKGRFDECAASHRWLKGTDPKSEKELENLITAQKEYIASCRKQKQTTLRDHMTNFIIVIRTKEFYKSTLLAMLIVSLYYFSGKSFCHMYIIDIIKKITHNEDTAYIGMLILDGVTVIGMYIGCILSNLFKRRPLLLFFSSIGISILFVISFYLYLIKLAIIQEQAFLSITFLAIFSLSVSCGPVIMSALLHGELLPLKFRSFSVCMIAIYTKLLMAIILKVAPFLFKTLGLHGTFMFYGVCSSIVVALIYKYLPETKDKTLQEIADSMTKKSRDEATQLVHKNHIEVISPASLLVK